MFIFYVLKGLEDGGLMIDEVAELRAQLEREQSLRVELEEQVKVYSARLGEVFEDPKPSSADNTQTTIQYHHNTNTVRISLFITITTVLLSYFMKLVILK